MDVAGPQFSMGESLLLSNSSGVSASHWTFQNLPCQWEVSPLLHAMLRALAFDQLF